MSLPINSSQRAVAIATLVVFSLVQPTLAGGKFMSHFGGGGGGQGHGLARVAQLKTNNNVPFKNGNLGVTGKGMPQSGSTPAGIPALRKVSTTTATSPLVTGNAALLKTGITKGKFNTPTEKATTSTKIKDLKSKVSIVDKLGKNPILTKDPGTTTAPPGGDGKGTGGGTGPGTGNGDGTGKGKQNGRGMSGGVSSLLTNLLSNLGGGGGGDDGGVDDGGGGASSADESTPPAAQVAEAPADAEPAAQVPAAEQTPVQVTTQTTDDVGTGSVDLVLEDVKLAEEATLVAGPSYSVRFRNQGLQSCGKFVVAAIASPSGKVDDDSPRVLLDVPGLGSGEMREVVLRLPSCEYSHLIVLVDATGVVVESDKTNNGAAIEAGALK